MSTGGTTNRNRNVFINKTLLFFYCLLFHLGDSIGDKIRCTLPENKQKILYVDTEQQKYHVGFLLRRVQSLSSNNGNIDEELFVYSLRSLSPKERVLKVKELIKSIGGLGLIIIDGIRDLVMSINDEVESTEIVSLLMKCGAPVSLRPVWQ